MHASLGLRALNANGATSSDPYAGDDYLVHFCQVAALVITLYDHLITLDREIEYIWSRRWSKSKALFILARYFGDLLLITDCFVFLNRDAGPLFCAIGLKCVGTGSMIIIIITQMIMQLRIKALYGQTVSHIITILWVMEVIAVVALGVASLVAIDVHPVVLQTSKMCNPTYLPPYAFLFWVPVIVFETFLFSLALRIAYRNYQEIGNWRGAALLHIVLRDNFNFFVCAFVAYIVTATTWLTANPRYFTVPGSFSCALTAIMGCRLILNLCEAYHHPRYPEMTPPESIWAATSGVRFESGSAGGGDGGATTRSSRGRVSASLGTWSRWPTREWRSGNGNGNGNGNVLSHGSMGGRGVGNATELCVTVTSAEGSGSSTTMTTTAATKKKNACDVLLEEGVYEMHALEVLELRSVAGHSAADGEDDFESVGVAAR